MSAVHHAHCAILNGVPEVCTCGLLRDFAAAEYGRQAACDEIDDRRVNTPPGAVLDRDNAAELLKRLLLG